ncbi:MAG: decarboxylase [Lachnospiraceae bacterium]|jgi:arginine decarboxylase|nr:decarboxylase [Lachnospiraceae bacterium]
MTKLYERLLAYGNLNVSPFHMPGHKRKKFSFGNPFAVDITEIDGFDNLHHPTGILKEAMEQAAAVYGAEKSYFLVNGSSCGILAAISACVPRGGKLLVARNCHKSVYHGMILRGLFPVYLWPEPVPGWEMSGAVGAEAVRQALLAHPDVKAVLVTSPTYEGICSDLKGICERAHRMGLPVIVDAAHGAHFSFGGICEPAVSCGADLVIESLHKTLPSLTQTAILHKNSRFVEDSLLEWYLQVYQTSSPSYVLMASIDSCVSYLTGEEGKRDMAFYEAELEKLRQKLKGLSHIRLLSGEEAGGACYDVSKLVVRAEGQSGKALYDSLRLEYGIQPEMCTEHYVILMTSVADSAEDFDRLYEALADMDRKWEKARGRAVKRPWEKERAGQLRPQVVFGPGEAMEKKKCSCRLEDCVGKVSGEFAYIYPPGIPLLVPGERITEEVLQMLGRYGKRGFEVLGPENLAGGELAVIVENFTESVVY